MQIKYISYPSGNRPSLLRKAGAVVATVALAVLALMFSAVLLAVILIVGTIAGVYLWWKTRELRKQMRDFQARSATMQSEAFKGEVFEGEVTEGEVIRN
jgi:uncharacterized membrane protein